MAKFNQVIECLKNGGTAQRMAWDATGDKEIMMQIPQRIAKDIVPRMTSVQQIVKPKISTVGSGEIEYHDQVIIITFTDDEQTPARATYYVPTWEDIFADDWRLTEPANVYFIRMTGESMELSERIFKLNKFLHTDTFAQLTTQKQQLLKKQQEAMSAYLEILQERIKLEQEAQGE